MTTIPDGIRKQAMRIAASGKDLAVVRIGIIQALMDERERCAKIAGAMTGVFNNAEDIAEAQRAGTRTHGQS